jgi:hypothetical protein
MFPEETESLGLHSSQGSASSPSSLSWPSTAKTTADTAGGPGRDKVPVNAQTKDSTDRKRVRNFHVVAAVGMCCKTLFKPARHHSFGFTADEMRPELRRKNHD